jgi:hypothetical protein
VSLWQLIGWNRLLVLLPLFQQPLQIGVTAYETLNDYCSSLVAYLRKGAKTEVFYEASARSVRKKRKDGGFREESARSVQKESKDGGFREASARSGRRGSIRFAGTQDSLPFGFLSYFAEQTIRNRPVTNLCDDGITVQSESSFALNLGLLVGK